MGDPYWADTSINGCNGYIIQTTNSSGVCSGLFGTAIPNDVSGPGYFLFIGTAGPNTPANNEFFISPTFTVTPGTQYSISFDLTNANTINNASIEPEIDGTLLTPGAMAAGSFPGGQQWQAFSFSWNSGANTTASLILHDLATGTTGNDFGIDAILVQPTATTPEPGTFWLFGGGTLASLGWVRRKRAR